MEKTPDSNVDVVPAHSTSSPLSDSEDKDKIDNCVDDSGAPPAVIEEAAGGAVNDNEEESGFEDNNEEIDDDSRCAHSLLSTF